MRMFDKLLGQSLAFSPNGKLLAVGFTNGTRKLLEPYPEPQPLPLTPAPTLTPTLSALPSL